jgi:hypothetical protein
VCGALIGPWRSWLRRAAQGDVGGWRCRSCPRRRSRGAFAPPALPPLGLCAGSPIGTGAPALVNARRSPPPPVMAARCCTDQLARRAIIQHAGTASLGSPLRASLRQPRPGTHRRDSADSAAAGSTGPGPGRGRDWHLLSYRLWHIANIMRRMAPARARPPRGEQVARIVAIQGKAVMAVSAISRPRLAQTVVFSRCYPLVSAGSSHQLACASNWPMA